MYYPLIEDMSSRTSDDFFNSFETFENIGYRKNHPYRIFNNKLDTKNASKKQILTACVNPLWKIVFFE